MSSRIPPNVVAYLRQEIARRTQYKAAIELAEIPPEFMEAELYEYLARMEKLKSNLSDLTQNTIIPVAKKYIPTLEIDPANDELTIAAILSILPSVEQTIVRKVFQGDG